MSKAVVELSREAGIEAIIALQAAAGIVETRIQAEAGWGDMSDGEKQNTMDAYAVVCQLPEGDCDVENDCGTPAN